MEQTNTNIKSFVDNIVNKQYKQANTSLHNIIEDKLKNRIVAAISQKKTTKLDK